jgi:P27 family predicted phage terminase small subunit
MTKTPGKADPVALLSAEARRVHDRLKREWRIQDGAGLLTLLTACQALDRLREAQAIIAREGIIKTDRFGQAKPHPATQVEKEARAGLLQSLKALNLDLESLDVENGD